MADISELTANLLTIAELTERIEEDLASLYAAFMAKLLKAESGKASTIIEEYIGDRFDVRGRWYLTAIRKESQVKFYLDTLDWVRKKDVEALKEHFASSLPHRELVDARIVGRISYWKSEAMRRVREKVAQEPREGMAASETSLLATDGNPNTVGDFARTSIADMNLTSQQKSLLFAIVDGHAASEGAPFIFVHHGSGTGLCYKGGRSVWVDADENDFVQLRRENLINFSRVSGGVLNGKPTQRGIEAAASLRSNESAGEPIGSPPVSSTSAVGTEGKASEAPAEKGADAPASEKVECAKVRSAWLDQKVAQGTNWTSDKDIEDNGGPSYNTIQRYRSGATSTRDLYVRRGLAKAFQCEIAEVPE
jgi:hypothetical protein